MELCLSFQHKQDMFFFSKALRPVLQPTQSLFNEYRALLSWRQAVKHAGCKAQTTIKNKWNIPSLPCMPSWTTSLYLSFKIYYIWFKQHLESESSSVIILPEKNFINICISLKIRTNW